MKYYLLPMEDDSRLEQAVDRMVSHKRAEVEATLLQVRDILQRCDPMTGAFCGVVMAELSMRRSKDAPPRPDTYERLRELAYHLGEGLGPCCDVCAPAA